MKKKLNMVNPMVTVERVTKKIALMNKQMKILILPNKVKTKFNKLILISMINS